MNAIPPNDFNFLSFFLQFGKSGFPPTGAGCRLLIPSWLEGNLSDSLGHSVFSLPSTSRPQTSTPNGSGVQMTPVPQDISIECIHVVRLSHKLFTSRPSLGSQNIVILLPASSPMSSFLSFSGQSQL